MAVPFSNTKLRVPRGFRNILEGLSREILRSQPSDIYAFGSLYFEKLLQIRAESGVDPVETGAQQEDRFYNNKAYASDALQHRETNVDQEMAALKIQTKYRQYTAKKVVRGMKEEKAAVKIQAVYRGHCDRKFVRCIKKNEDSASTEALEAARMEDEEEEEREGDSPSKILGSDFPDKKGLDKSKVEVTKSASAHSMEKVEDMPESTPEEQDERKTEEKEEEEEEEEEETGEVGDIEDAAIRIQAGMRGLLTRMSLKAQQLTPDQQADTTEDENEDSATKEDGEIEESSTKEDDEKEGSTTKEDAEKEDSATKVDDGKEGSATKVDVEKAESVTSVTKEESDAEKTE